MKQKIATIALAMLPLLGSAQPARFFGIARKNTPANEVFLARINPSTGVVTNLSTSSLSESINLTGAALDPYNNHYHYTSGDQLKTIDLATGDLVTSATIYNPIAASYFDNLRFNNSDTTLYGLARRVTYDSVTMTSTGEVYLAKINTTTGEITQLSPTSVGQGYSIGGNATDPYQKIYYYTTGSHLVGLDMYTGTVFSSTPMVITDGIIFDNLAYSCVDTAIYGLIRQNYFDTLVDPLDPTMTTVVLDSATLRLGRINPATGVVTTISPYTIAQGGYSLNAGATVDPDAKIYYYNNGGELVGVSLETGTIVTNATLSFTNGQFFELMRIQDNCIDATVPTRKAPASLTVTTVGKESKVTIAPNPANSTVTITGTDIAHIELTDVSGKVVYSTQASGNNISIDLSALPTGVYFTRIQQGADVLTKRIVKQ